MRLHNWSRSLRCFMKSFDGRSSLNFFKHIFLPNLVAFFLFFGLCRPLSYKFHDYFFLLTVFITLTLVPSLIHFQLSHPLQPFLTLIPPFPFVHFTYQSYLSINYSLINLTSLHFLALISPFPLLILLIN